MSGFKEEARSARPSHALFSRQNVWPNKVSTVSGKGISWYWSGVVKGVCTPLCETNGTTNAREGGMSEYKYGVNGVLILWYA